MRTWLRRTSLSMLAAGTFTVSLVASAVLHLELPVARRAAADVTRLALADTPARTSTITIGSIERTSSAIIVHDVNGDFADEHGRPALSVRGASGRVRYVELLRQWITSGDLTLAAEDVHASWADVSLDDDGQTLPRVARAFAAPAAPPSPSPGGPSSFTFLLGDVVIDHIWAHGSLAGRGFDADVDELRGRLALEDGLQIRIEEASVMERGLPRPARARVRGLVGVPSVGPVELAGDVDGTFGDARAHVRVMGTVERLDAVGFARQEGGTVDLTASMWLPEDGSPLRAVASVRTRELPLRVVYPDAPEGALSVDAFGSVAFAHELEARAWARTYATTIGGQRVPEVLATASGKGRAWRVDALAKDEGGDVLAGADFEGSHVRADALVDLNELSRIGPLPPTPVHGRAHARLDVEGDLGTRNLDGSITGVASGVSYGPVRADVLDLAGKVAWRGDRGTADASATLRQGDAQLDLAARDVHFDAGGVSSGAATLRTARGRADAAVRMLGGGTVADATVTGLRVSALLPFVRASFPVKDAVLGGTLDLRSAGGVLHGKLHARADDLAFSVGSQAFEKVAVTLDAKLDDHDASYVASAFLDGEAALGASSAHVHVPVLAFDRASLLAITGRTQLRANSTFACLRTWFGDRVPSSVGQAEVRLVYEHEQGTPHLASFEAATTGAEASAGTAGKLRGIDARVGGIVSLDDGHADIVASLHDGLGPLVLARLGTAFGAPVWDTVAVADLDRWKRAPTTLHLELPDRDIATLPLLVRPADIEGRIAAALDVTGSAAAPQATFSIDEHGGRISTHADEPPLDLHVDGSYDRKVLAATAVADDARASSLDAEVKVQLPWADVLAGRAGDTWEASATLRAKQLALGAIAGWFTRTPISGTVSGVATVRGLHRDAVASVDLVLDEVAVRRRQVGRGHVVALLSNGQAAANVTLVQQVGRLDVAASGKAEWGPSLAPSLDLVAGLDGYVRAKAFDVSFLRPLLRDVVPGFNAVIDSALAVHLTPDLKTSHAVGMLTLSSGRAEVATLGDEVRDVRVRVDIAEDGKAKISQVEIYPATGRINGDGDAVFEGLDFRSALLHLRIPRGNEIPVGLEGLPVGELEGNIDVALRRAAHGLDVGVTIPSIHLLLAPALGRDVQSLEPDPHVHFGKRDEAGVFTAFAGAPVAAEGTTLPVHIDVTLGDDVWLRRRSDLEARVTGSVAIDLGKQLRLGGAATVPEGWVEIQGRRFNVERARISFDGQPPSDPIVQATARYDAPGGVKIFADYVGPVSTGRMFLHSEPAMSPNEIVSTLIFGSPTAQVGTAGGSSQDTALQAAALGGGYVTQGLNRALEDISPLDVSTRVDATAPANPRPELTVKVTKDVGVTLGVNLGTPSPGQPPDRTILRIDYQFLPQWRLRSTSGDKGSSILDFIWQYRY